MTPRPTPILTRTRNALRRPVVPALIVAMVLTAGSAAAANGQLQIFRTERIAAVSFSTDDLVSLPDLTAYGDVLVNSEPDIHPVDDAATAAAESGLEMPTVKTLPRGVSGDPEYQVGRQVSATFTFSADRAARAAAGAGERLPPPPPGLDGTQVRLTAGPGVAQIWTQPSGIPSLVVARAVAPTASSSGVPFDTVRDYLLSLPGVPDHVASQLRALEADGSTLPLPVPADRFSTSAAEVNGASATLLADRDRTLAAAVWVDDGVLTVVAGAVDTGEVLAIARDLS